MAQQRNSVFKSVDLNNAGYAERDCLSGAANNVLGPSNARLAGYQQQIRGLNANIRRASDNAAGAAWESGLRSQIAGLEQAIAMERGAAESRMDSERQRCAAARANAATAIEKKYSPEKP